MAKRITVVLDDEIVKKLHAKQAAAIKKSSKSVSFSIPCFFWLIHQSRILIAFLTDMKKIFF